MCSSDLYFLAVLVENKPGVLTHVSGLISRRAFNIESISAGYTEEPSVTRINIVVSVESENELDQVVNQLSKLIDVIKIVNPKDGETLNIEIPQFDTIVSNLPFIDFCRHNTHDTSDLLAKNKVATDVTDRTRINISDRSDYYMYIIFHLWNLLKDGGTACVLTSNAWMATAAGSLFINALSQYFVIKGIIKS